MTAGPLAGAEVDDPRPPVEPKPVTRRLVRIAAMSTYALLLGLWTLLLGVPDDTVSIFVWLWLGTVAWNIEAPWRYQLRFPRDWAAPVIGLILYFYSRGLTDNLGVPVHYSLPVDVDRWVAGLFGAHHEIPTEILQRHLCGDPCDPLSPARWYDVLFTTVYTSHFVTGLTIAAVLWVRDRAKWVPWMRRYVVINFSALVIYVVYPMAPPWLAAQKGYLPMDVSRLTSRGWSGLGLGRLSALQGVGNPVAAMPSLHAGVSTMVAIYFITRLRSPWRWLLVLYPCTMGLALVYYGEHYVTDIAAGVLLAVVVSLGCSAWERRRPATSVTPAVTSS